MSKTGQTSPQAIHQTIHQVTPEMTPQANPMVIPTTTPMAPVRTTLQASPADSISSVPTLTTRRSCLLLLASLPGALLSSGKAQAQGAASDLQSYDVELVIFRTLTSEATPERWELEAQTTGQALALPDDDPAPFDTDPRSAIPVRAQFPALDASRYQLTAIADTLRRSRNYRPLAHFGWTQPGYPRNAAQSLSIDGRVPAGSGLSGDIALTRGRYLHLTLNLALQAEAASGQTPLRYVMHQSRRMRSNERHYIDHPNFGVIVLVSQTPR